MSQHFITVRKGSGKREVSHRVPVGDAQPSEHFITHKIPYHKVLGVAASWQHFRWCVDLDHPLAARLQTYYLKKPNPFALACRNEQARSSATAILVLEHALLEQSDNLAPPTFSSSTTTNGKESCFEF